MAKAPKLKLKAGEGRKFLPVLIHMLSHCFPSTSPHDVMRLQCASNLLHVYQEIDDWIDTGGESLARFKCYSMRHLMLFAELSRERAATGEGLEWRLYPKHHLSCHVFLDATQNPKWTWAYRLESEIGLAANLAAAVNVQHMHTAFIKRYRASHSINEIKTHYQDHQSIRQDSQSVKTVMIDCLDL